MLNFMYGVGLHRKSMFSVNKFEKQWKKQLHFQKDEGFEKKAKKSWHLKFHPASEKELHDELADCDAIVVGDHRINPAHMQKWTDLLNRCVDSTWVLVTDRFDVKQQGWVQAYLMRRMSQSELFQKFGWREPLTQCPEGGMGIVLEWIRNKNISVIYKNPEGDFKKQTEVLYECAKSQIKKTLLWTGSLKVAPIWNEKYGPIKKKQLLLQMECKSESSIHADWLRADRCWMNNQNDVLLNIELTRLWNEHVNQFVSPDKISKVFFQIVQKIQNIFYQQNESNDGVVIHPYQSDFDEKVQQLDGKTRKFLQERLENMESAVIPKYQLAMICRLDQVSIAEEAMHFLRLHQSSKKDFGPWQTVWEEAWGFWARLWVDAHHKLDVEKASTNWELVHDAGYRLGEKIFALWTDPKTKHYVQDMFLWDADSEEKAQHAFDQAMQIIKEKS
ncbi:MAG: hypothetical protein KDD46_07740 [Bdellovibrionales bacterium]|nr:hypothetical protein [Bdellovibrionales bacterium]